MTLPEGKEVFFLYTGGAMPSGCPKSMTDAVQSKSAHILGHFGCLGYDTYGPFKLVGGIAKGHPNQTDCQNAVAFFERL